MLFTCFHAGPEALPRVPRHSRGRNTTAGVAPGITLYICIRVSIGN